MVGIAHSRWANGPAGLLGSETARHAGRRVGGGKPQGRPHGGPLARSNFGRCVGDSPAPVMPGFGGVNFQ
eukprot:10346518-Alexandrium_andersonii.AAC.1